MLYKISLIIFIRKLERGGQRESSSVYCDGFFLSTGTCILYIRNRSKGKRETERKREECTCLYVQ